MNRLILTVIFCVLLTGCSSYPMHKYEDIESRALAAGFKTEIFKSSYFDLYIRSKNHTASDVDRLVVYIEGDGRAWINKRRVSRDPTPRTPVAMLLALEDPRDNVAYIGRPCQYVMQFEGGNNCDKKYWTSHRFSDEVINSINDAVSWLKRKNGVRSIELVGFSGGGAVAALIADKRKDIELLRTVAGNLDHVELNNYHGVSLLSNSRNPIDIAHNLSVLCQMHYSGTDDRIVPSFIAKAFISKLQRTDNAYHLVIKNQGHTGSWQTVWPNLLFTSPSCH